MKIKLVLLISLCLLWVYGNAQNDTIYFMSKGAVVNKQSIKSTDIDSVIFYAPNIHQTSTFTDSRDGNVYKTVVIDNTVWMAENLRYLPAVCSPQTSSNSNPYYYVYGYYGTSTTDAQNTDNYKTYGVLYNWAAANAACPPGWHLPTYSEWDKLNSYTGGMNNNGVKLRETGISHWKTPNSGATDELGFKALPGGYMFDFGSFSNITESGFFWSSTEINTLYAFMFGLNYNESRSYLETNNKSMGYSIRCVKDK